MTEDIFINKFTENWNELESLNELVKMKSIKSLDKNNLQKFQKLYNEASYNLAYSKTYFGNCNTTQYLNSLVATSHNIYYVKKKVNPKEVISYILSYFGKIINTNRKYIISATLIFFISAVVTALLVLFDYNNIYYFFPEEVLATINLSSKDQALNTQFFLSSFITINNILVSVKAFVYGLFLGLGTIYVLAYNGAILGALWAFVFTNRFSQLSFWSLILPHGFIELSAIFICGGAGLMLGKAILMPNEFSRKHALIKAGKEAVSFIPGICLMLLIAGTIEGFFTPLNISEVIKIIFSFITLVLFFLYLIISNIKRKAD